MHERIRQIIADELQRPCGEVKVGTSLRKELGMDSVAAINIVFAIEDAFGIEVPESELEGVDDMAQIVGLVDRYVSQG